jgi:hypothetical protein
VDTSDIGQCKQVSNTKQKILTQFLVGSFAACEDIPKYNTGHQHKMTRPGANTEQLQKIIWFVATSLNII